MHSGCSVKQSISCVLNLISIFIHSTTKPSFFLFYVSAQTSNIADCKGIQKGLSMVWWASVFLFHNNARGGLELSSLDTRSGGPGSSLWKVIWVVGQGSFSPSFVQGTSNLSRKLVGILSTTWDRTPNSSWRMELQYSSLQHVSLHSKFVPTISPRLPWDRPIQ